MLVKRYPGVEIALIQCCCMFADDKPIMYEKQFLQDIAVQNFTKYKVTSRSKSPIRVRVDPCSPVGWGSACISTLAAVFYCKILNFETLCVKLTL